MGSALRIVLAVLVAVVPAALVAAIYATRASGEDVLFGFAVLAALYTALLPIAIPAVRAFRRQREALRRREGILAATAFAAGRFLSGSSWEEHIDEVLARLGGATDVSRVYIFENRLRGDGTLLMDERFEWVATGIAPTIDDPDNRGCPYLPEYPRYLELLGSGQPMHGPASGFPESERADLESEGIRSCAMVPIFARDSWWGYVGFDDCMRDRRWSEAELDALRVAAGTLGAAIDRKRVEAARFEVEARATVPSSRTSRPSPTWTG